MFRRGRNRELLLNRILELGGGVFPALVEGLPDVVRSRLDLLCNRSLNML